MKQVPTWADPGLPPLPTFPVSFATLFFFSTFKTSNFALGMSRMKCHLPIKRETGEKSCIALHMSSLKSRLASDFETVTMREYYFFIPPFYI